MAALLPVLPAALPDASAGGAGAAGPGRGVLRGARGLARPRGSGAALGRAGRGRRTGAGAACRPRTCAARARPRYIAGWRRRQLSSAARAAAAEVRGSPAGEDGGWLGDGDNNDINDDGSDDGSDDDGGGDDGSGGGGTGGAGL